MADHGITFSAPMVRALLDGRKTQTRRLITKKPALDALAIFKPAFLMLPGNVDLLPRAPSDRLYVREHWKAHIAYEDLAPSEMGGEETILYLADMSLSEPHPDMPERCVGRHRQAMHMPRWASRLTLLVTDVRVQRLGEISEPDALAEGVIEFEATETDNAEFAHSEGGLIFATAVEAYAALWNSLHTTPGTRWEDNPWIYAVTFDVRHGNIDQRDAI